ncbi:MAG: DNA translocase FtsK [Candidatus Coatesbacteria bacterium]|nr:DNA translocase FtsK [Candidatus Coatesbacteria bacterium]
MAKRNKPGGRRNVELTRRITMFELFRERVFKEALSVLMIAAAATSLVSLWGGDSETNPVGLVGRWIAGAFALVFGKVPSYPLLVVLFVFAFATLIRRKPRLLPLKIVAAFAFTIALGTMYALIQGYASTQEAFFARELARFLVDYFSALWAIVLTTALLLTSAILVAGVGIGQVFSFIVRVFRRRTKQGADAADFAIVDRRATSAELAEPVPAKSKVKSRKSKVESRRPKPVQEKATASAVLTVEAVPDGSYRGPAVDLLDPGGPMDSPERQSDLAKKGQLIVEKLADHGVEGTIEGILTGPIITRFEFRPARGVKLSRIISLADDLALAMKAKFVPRIAPIPGRSVVGIEIANESRRTISFREVMSSSQFADNPARLKLAVGTDIAGQPHVISLEHITHILIAGATGTGKSVCINSMLCSLLYSTSPEELELILIDPKMLELSPYNGVPHLREPVISDVESAELAFRWAVSEMDHRYQILAERQVRHINEYNERVLDERKARASELKGLSPEEMPSELKTIPNLVIVVDELADLMLSARQAIEVPIIRLAAKARAAGIYLVLATQRPSVDVVTGLIKTNFPSRLAFRVAQKVDSRTILDQNGAEKLLGRGDMLFLTPGVAGLTRLHGSFISEREIERIVKHLRKQPAPVRESSIFDEVQQLETLDIEGTDDPIYRNAVEIVVQSKYASISLLQRKLKIGHGRAARYIDMMEQQGVVGPFRGSKPRAVLKDDVSFE